MPVSEEKQALLDLYKKLDEAEEQSRSGKTLPFHQVMAELRIRIISGKRNYTKLP